MKLNRTYLFIIISSIALIAVLIIQVNWIFETARIKEDLFNEKANIILARTSEALSSDKVISKNLEANLGRNEIQTIDSLIKSYMNYYNFHVVYSFKIVKSFAPIPSTIENQSLDSTTQQACSSISLNEMRSTNGWELKLIFPEKKQFILAEMGTPFITSILLILVVLILFWRTISSLIQEKKISEHTTDFLNNMTHEFKTPLTNIALASKMIIKEQACLPKLHRVPPLDSVVAEHRQEDKIKHYSGIILEENEKLRLQVEQVLSMTALERGEIPLQKTELDFHGLIHDTVKSMNIQIENKRGRIKLNLNAENCVVLGDKTHLTNALCNLIDNAIKYSKEKPEITIQTTNINNNLIVAISDKGIGIEKEYQNKVFDKFFRVPTGNVHNVKGFGLGLAYIKKIIELHGGAIQLNSEGQGTSFNITLPNA